MLPLSSDMHEFSPTASGILCLIKIAPVVVGYFSFLFLFLPCCLAGCVETRVVDLSANQTNRSSWFQHFQQSKALFTVTFAGNNASVQAPCQVAGQFCCMSICITATVSVRALRCSKLRRMHAGKRLNDRNMGPVTPPLLACFFMGGAPDCLPGRDMVIIFRMRPVTSGTADWYCTALPCSLYPPPSRAQKSPVCLSL